MFFGLGSIDKALFFFKIDVVVDHGSSSNASRRRVATSVHLHLLTIIAATRTGCLHRIVCESPKYETHACSIGIFAFYHNLAVEDTR